MKTPSMALVAALALVGCRHAQTVYEPNDEEEAAPATRSGGTGGAGEPLSSEKPKDQRAPTEPGRPPLATSPEGLMVPGGVSRLQEALNECGFLQQHRSSAFDEQTSAALRKFQEKEGLARTGAPDRETLRRLGLDPTELFRTTDKMTTPPD